jgi:Ca2+-binding EF-hand superfamily protein
MSEQILAILNDEAKFNEIVQASFEAVDTDKTGKIEVNELEAAMKQVSSELGVPAPSKEEVNEVFEKLDTDKSGTISAEEFKSFVRMILEGIAEMSK